MSRSLLCDRLVSTIICSVCSDDTIREQNCRKLGPDATLVWVSPIDIAAAIVEELESTFVGRKIRYVVSDELTGNETASILGTAIGKPDLKWAIIPSDQMQSGLEKAGLNPKIAAGLVEMYGSQQSGLLMEDYYLNKPAVMGKVKLKDFAKGFAIAF